ncbi:MAG: 4Fe-4S binding protein [Deltaproteobacteria bacterium]|nr:4Fe-4S binding protein [Deltaproteobacteria bacterium]
MKTLRNIIEIDEEKCDGCGLCVPSCAEGAIRIIDGKARLVAEKFCDGLGACLGECPRDAIRIVQKEVEAFDEQAAMEQVERQKMEDNGIPAAPLHPSSGCPSARLMNFPPPQVKGDAQPVGCPAANLHSFAAAKGERPGQETYAAAIPSALSHWPVQIRLVPPHAPFLNNADLLIAADCSPMAYGDFHRDFLKGKVVMMGCPKFDDMALYEERFQQIFRQAEIKSVTVLVMEVPCCQGLPALVKKALKESAKEIPLEIVTIGLRGKILRRDAYPNGI